MDARPPLKFLVFGAALFLLGCAAGIASAARRPGFPLVVCAAGVILVLAFRTYERYLSEQEKRIAVLEAMRRSAERQREGLSELFMSFAEVFAQTEDKRLSAGHREFRRIQKYAMDTAAEMSLDADTVEALKTAALLHDVGKVFVPNSVWTKTEPLNEDEWRLVKAHVSHAENLLAGVPFPWPVAPIIRAHHERWDGQGYPLKLRGEDIPIGARILAVADAYEALMSERPHRPAQSWKQALDTLWVDAGKRYDPEVVKAFGKVIAKGAYVDLDVHPSRAGVTRVTRQVAPKPA